MIDGLSWDLERPIGLRCKRRTLTYGQTKFLRLQLLGMNGPCRFMRTLPPQMAIKSSCSRVHSWIGTKTHTRQPLMLAPIQGLTMLCQTFNFCFVLPAAERCHPHAHHLHHPGHGRWHHHLRHCQYDTPASMRVHLSLPYLLAQHQGKVDLCNRHGNQSSQRSCMKSITFHAPLAPNASNFSEAFDFWLSGVSVHACHHMLVSSQMCKSRTYMFEFSCHSSSQWTWWTCSKALHSAAHVGLEPCTLSFVQHTCRPSKTLSNALGSSSLCRLCALHDAHSQEQIQQAMNCSFACIDIT